MLTRYRVKWQHLATGCTSRPIGELKWIKASRQVPAPYPQILSLLAPLPGRTQIENKLEVNSVDFSPDGQTIASNSNDDGNIKLWRRSGTLVVTLTKHSDRVSSVDFSPDGQTLASSSEDGTVILWSLNLDDLLARGSKWLKDYLVSHPEEREVRNICQNTKPSL